MLIGDVIRIGLTRKKWKFRELAEELNVRTSSVSQWVNNHSIPPGDKMIKIIEILDLVDEFFPNSQGTGRGLYSEKSPKYKKTLDELAVEIYQLTTNQMKIVSEFNDLNNRYKLVCSQLEEISNEVKNNEKPT